MRRMLRDYITEILEPTLLLGFLCSLLGIAAAAKYGAIRYVPAFLVVLGAVMAQVATNLMDDYHDYKVGIDKETVKTKFSGGSGLLKSGAILHRHVLYLAIVFAFLAGIIGLYLAFTVSLWLLALIAIGAISIFFYASYLVRFPLFSEPLAMIGFALIGVGSFVVAHGSFAGLGNALFAVVPAGMLIGIALLVNEVPDAEIDKKYGRRHAVIILKKNSSIALYYLALQFLTYAIVIYGVVRSILNPFFLLVLVTLPFTFYVARGILKYRNPASFERFMAANVVSILIYLVLLVVAYSL